MTTWTHWAKGERCAPNRIARPRHADDVSEAVASAAAAGRRVRAVGSGHSFGDQTFTDGTLVQLDDLSGILGVDPERGTVTVAAGTKLWRLNELLAVHGLALPNLGDIDRQSVAGATATGTHGTGARLQNLSAGIVSMQLVLADGAQVSIDEDDPETLAAARVAIGSLGVVTSLTLQVVPAFALRYEHGTLPLSIALNRIDDLVDSNERFEFFVFPYTSTAWTKTINATSEAGRPVGAFSRYLNEIVVENYVLDALCRLGNARQSAIPTLNRLLTKFGSGDATRVDQSHRILPSRRLVRFNEAEWALPRENGAEALREMHRMVEQRRLPVSFPLELRFTAADQRAFLSPSWERETAYVAAHMYAPMDYRPYFDAVQEIAVAFGGRPHWGKRHTLVADQLAGLYPAWDRFQAVRSRLDPNGIFTNGYTDRVLGRVRPEAGTAALASQADPEGAAR